MYNLFVLIIISVILSLVLLLLIIFSIFGLIFIFKELNSNEPNSVKSTLNELRTTISSKIKSLSQIVEPKALNISNLSELTGKCNDNVSVSGLNKYSGSDSDKILAEVYSELSKDSNLLGLDKLSRDDVKSENYFNFTKGSPFKSSIQTQLKDTDEINDQNKKITENFMSKFNFEEDKNSKNFTDNYQFEKELSKYFHSDLKSNQFKDPDIRYGYQGIYPLPKGGNIKNKLPYRKYYKVDNWVHKNKKNNLSNVFKMDLSLP